MLGYLYLISASYVGLLGLKSFIPGIFQSSRRNPISAEQIELKSWILILPASFLTGTILLTWATYLLALAFAKTIAPLFYANSVIGIIFAIFITKKIKTILNFAQRLKIISLISLREWLLQNKTELLLVGMALAVSSFLMFDCFYTQDDNPAVGAVYSDFSAHLAMIRSFSWGKNFPTNYPHFTNAGIRYHFFFLFLAGNLEHLGLPLVQAFNIPSVLGMTALFMLLYTLAIILTNNKGIAFMTCMLFLFRSSMAFIDFWSKVCAFPPGQVLSTLQRQTLFIGKTPLEDWGIWTIFVYVSQRHLVFCIALMLLIVILMLDRFSVKGSSASRWKELYASKDAWWPNNMRQTLALGLILGLSAYWNGAVLIATLLVLFFLAIGSRHKTEFIVVAIIALALAQLQSLMFITTGKSAVSPTWNPGFIAPTKSFTGILHYIFQTFGLFPLLLLFSLWKASARQRYLTFVFLTPLLLAFTFKLTTDIVMNHKFVAISIILLNIFVAKEVIRFFKEKTFAGLFMAEIFLLLLTLTGISDHVILHNLNRNGYILRRNSPALHWAKSRTDPQDTFLTGYYTMHPILHAGRQIFYGWPYFSQTAGYNTVARGEIVKLVYEGQDLGKIRTALIDNSISYITIDETSLDCPDYEINTGFFRKNFIPVFESNTDNIIIYSTKEFIQQQGKQ